MFRKIGLTFVALSVLLSACTTNRVVKLYEGPERPVTDIAVLTMPVQLDIVTINDRQVQGVNAMFSMTDKELHVEPGRYRIAAQYRDVWDKSASTHEVVRSNPVIFTVEAEAGQHYRLDYEHPETLEDAREMVRDFQGWTENTATGERTATTPSGITTRGVAGITTVQPERTETPATAIAPEARDESASEGDYLDMLKAYWSQATEEERRQFLRWISR